MPVSITAVDGVSARVLSQWLIIYVEHKIHKQTTADLWVSRTTGRVKDVIETFEIDVSYISPYIRPVNFISHHLSLHLH